MKEQEKKNTSHVPAETEKDRGIALTGFIIAHAIFALFNILMLYGSLAEIDAYARQFEVLDFSSDYFAVYRDIGLMILIFIATIGLWYWKRTAYISLIPLYLIIGILAFMDDNRLWVGVYIISILFLEIFLQDKNRKQYLR